MHYINIDEKSNGCAVCCCAPIGLRPGEVSLITLNYAPWTIPIMSGGGPGLVPTPDFSVVEDAGTCSTSEIDGFAPPSVGGDVFNAALALAVNTPLELDLVSDVAPAGNTFIFELVPMSGPYHGTLSAVTPNGAAWMYTPNTGFQGYDQFWVKVTDAQGRVLIRPVNIKIGVPTEVQPFGWGPNAATGVQIDRTTAKVDQRQQTLSFAVMLPPSNGCDTIDGCKRYRVSVKAFARDCDRQFSHISCFDVFCKKC